jgi:hypothetical protein
MNSNMVLNHNDSGEIYRYLHLEKNISTFIDPDKNELYLQKK